jgi:NADH-quinone oxidoreductase subunit F
VFSGVSNPVVTGDQLGTALTYEAFEQAGSGMGAGGFIVYDDTACMVEVARLFSRFLAVESCGQCPPCKIGSQAITERLARIEAGAGTEQDVAEIGGWLDRVTDGNRCYLAVEERVLVASMLRAFPEEFTAHLEGNGCPFPRPVVFPKLVDLGGGRAVYDDGYHLKQPDWTYADMPSPTSG